jgi:hypothetical protein
MENHSSKNTVRLGSILKVCAGEGEPAPSACCCSVAASRWTWHDCVLCSGGCYQICLQNRDVVLLSWGQDRDIREQGVKALGSEDSVLVQTTVNCPGRPAAACKLDDRCHVCEENYALRSPWVLVYLVELIKLFHAVLLYFFLIPEFQESKDFIFNITVYF